MTAALSTAAALGIVAPAAAVGGPALGGPGAPLPPPGSVISHDVDVTVTPGGDLHIVGDEGRNRVDIHGNGAGYAVWVHKGNGQVVPHNLGPISGNVFVDLGGANDRVEIGVHGPVSFPGYLVVEGGAGGDQLRIENTEVTEELIIRPGTGTDGDVYVVNVTVGDDLRYESGENTDFDLLDSTVGARMVVTTPGPNDWADVDIVRSEVGRLLAFTGARRDLISTSSPTSAPTRSSTSVTATTGSGSRATTSGPGASWPPPESATTRSGPASTPRPAVLQGSPRSASSTSASGPTTTTCGSPTVWPTAGPVRSCGAGPGPTPSTARARPPTTRRPWSGGSTSADVGPERDRPLIGRGPCALGR